MAQQQKPREKSPEGHGCVNNRCLWDAVASRYFLFPPFLLRSPCCYWAGNWYSQPQPPGFHYMTQHCHQHPITVSRSLQNQFLRFIISPILYGPVNWALNKSFFPLITNRRGFGQSNLHGGVCNCSSKY